MRRIFLGAGVGLAILLSLSPGAMASVPHGPSSLQTQCLSAGGSFSIGYEADTYVCISDEGTIQTCHFGAAPSCSVEDGPMRNKPAQSQSTQNVPRAPILKYL